MFKLLRLLLLVLMVFGISADPALAAADQVKCKKCTDQCVRVRQQCIKKACADNNGFFVRPNECKIKEAEYQDKYREEVKACREKSELCLKQCDSARCK